MRKEYNIEASKELIELAKNGNTTIQGALEKGADPNYRDESGWSAMDFATTGMYSRDKLYNGGLNSMSVGNMDLLIKAGVDPYEVGGTSYSPVQNLIIEASHANELSGIGDVKHKAVTEGKEEPFGDFVTKVRKYSPPQQSNHDAYLVNGYLQRLVEGRNAYLQQELAQAREASGVVVEPRPSAPAKPGKWTDTVAMVGANYSDQLSKGATSVETVMDSRHAERQK